MEIPQDLDEVIFEKLHGRYDPRPEEVSFNLNAGEEQIQWYLGTYYPRSYVEAYETFRNVIRSEVILNSFCDKREIIILDIGSGTGGYLAGVIHAIRDSIGPKDIISIAIDGNENALKYQKEISDELADINLILELNKINLDRETFVTELSHLLARYTFKYDIIICSKFLSEFFRNPRYDSSYNARTQGLYRDFLFLAEKWLQSEGMSIINDVTISVNDAIGQSPYLFIPKIANTEMLQYLENENSSLKCIIPLSCAFWGERCLDPSNCFHQQVFEVKHSHLQNPEITKVFYKIFVPNTYAGDVLRNVRKSDHFVIAPGKYCLKGEYSWNPPQLPAELLADAFALQEGDL